MIISVNARKYSIDVEENMPLLWVLRDELNILGPKYGCGIGQCGSCTVHIDGAAVRSCQVAVAEVDGEITTIENPAPSEEVVAVQNSWIEHQVAQCGYCQAGQIMNAAALLKIKPDPTDNDIDRYMSGNLCRCGTYPRIRAAIKSAASRIQEA